MAAHLAQLGEVLLRGGLARPVARLLGDVQVSAGVVEGGLRLAHGAVRVTQGPARAALANLGICPWWTYQKFPCYADCRQYS